jgi:hypothetical protein
MYAQLTKSVTKMILWIEKQGPWRDTRGARDRINAAILKTLKGRHTWDPETKDLSKHLLDSVTGDISNEIKRAKRFPHVSLDDDREEHDHDKLEAQTSHAMASANQSVSEQPALILIETVAKLRERAPKDAAVLAILDAYDRGAFMRRDILKLTRMSARVYDAAMKRLHRLAAPLAVDVLEALDKAS